MKEIKRRLLRIFFALEIAGFVFIYIFGVQGQQVLRQIQKENMALEYELAQLRAEVTRLEHQVADWQHNSFAKERLAREMLQLAHADDQIYYLP